MITIQTKTFKHDTMGNVILESSISETVGTEYDNWTPEQRDYYRRTMAESLTKLQKGVLDDKS